MNPRNRNPGPQLPPESLYVRAPRLVQEWIGRTVVLHVEAETGGAKIPAGMRWRIDERSNLRGHFRLSGVRCECCGITPRITLHGDALRNPLSVGWLPL